MHPALGRFFTGVKGLGSTYEFGTSDCQSYWMGYRILATWLLLLADHIKMTELNIFILDNYKIEIIIMHPW